MFTLRRERSSSSKHMKHDEDPWKMKLHQNEATMAHKGKSPMFKEVQAGQRWLNRHQRRLRSTLCQICLPCGGGKPEVSLCNPAREYSFAAVCCLPSSAGLLLPAFIKALRGASCLVQPPCLEQPPRICPPPFPPAGYCIRISSIEPQLLMVLQAIILSIIFLDSIRPGLGQKMMTKSASLKPPQHLAHYYNDSEITLKIDDIQLFHYFLPNIIISWSLAGQIRKFGLHMDPGP